VSPHVHPIYDWETERVFDGYDPLSESLPLSHDNEYCPIEDGFAYPAPDAPEPREGCYCTQDPLDPHNAIICEPCFDRLLSE
jgi:hypothetical protein